MSFAAFNVNVNSSSSSSSISSIDSSEDPTGVNGRFARFREKDRSSTSWSRVFSISILICPVVPGNRGSAEID